MKYKVGMSQTQSTTTQHAWKFSAEASYKMFSANAEYSGFVNKTTSSTWSEEKEESHSISVTEGETVAVWQYVFTIEQYGDEWSFQSTIIGDTNSLDVKPTL